MALPTVSLPSCKVEQLGLTQRSSCRRSDPPTIRSLRNRGARRRTDVFLGEDILPWMVLAIGGALAVGTALAMVRPPRDTSGNDLPRPPKARSFLMIALGAVAAVWGLASLFS